MKLSFKTILPIILISALLILLAGCFGVPGDESPGTTTTGTGIITGIIAAPCCDTSGEPVSENSGSPEYWCYWCYKDWFIQGDVEVILTSGQDEIATTTTDEDGKYTFTDVPPGENYVITAYCPDKEIPLVKDVVPELAKGGSFNAGTTDLVSTSLGLVVDYVVYFAAWDPEDISLNKVIAAKPNFDGFPKFKKLIREVRRVLENCEDVDADDNLLDALCKAAEEVGKSDMGCAPGLTPEPEPEPEPEPTGGAPTPPPPPPPPPPGACDGNTAPAIDPITLDTAIVGVLYSGQINVTDDGTVEYEKISGPEWLNISSTGALSGTPVCDDVCSCGERIVDVKFCDEITVKVTDNCGASVQESFCITVTATNLAPAITSTPGLAAEANTLYTYTIVATDTDCWDSITYSKVVGPTGMSITGDTISWTPTCAQIGDHSVTVRATDNGSPALYDEQSFTITVSSTNLAPAITPIPDVTVKCCQTYTYQIIATDTDCWDSITYSKVVGPTGMNVHPTTGLISWPIGYHGETKDYSVTVRATDNGGLYTEQTFIITVTPWWP